MGSGLGCCSEGTNSSHHEEINWRDSWRGRRFCMIQTFQQPPDFKSLMKGLNTSPNSFATQEGLKVKEALGRSMGHSLPVFIVFYQLVFLRARSWSHQRVHRGSICCEVLAGHCPHFVLAISSVMDFGQVLQAKVCK